MHYRHNFHCRHCCTHEHDPRILSAAAVPLSLLWALILISLALAGLGSALIVVPACPLLLDRLETQRPMEGEGCACMCTGGCMFVRLPASNAALPVGLYISKCHLTTTERHDTMLLSHHVLSKQNRLQGPRLRAIHSGMELRGRLGCVRIEMQADRHTSTSACENLPLNEKREKAKSS